MDATGSPRPEALVRRRHQLSRARTTCAPGRTGSPRPSARCTTPRRRPTHAARVQALRARLLHHGRARLGHVATRTAWRWARRRRSCMDTGHHAPGTNIEFIVASLLRAGRLGAFDFNRRFYADDDLMVGAADPFQLFRIMYEIVEAGATPARVGHRLHARPVPQHRGQDAGDHPVGDERAGGHGQGAPRRPGRARPRPRAAGDVLGANGVLMDAYSHRRPPAAAPNSARSMGMDPDPIARLPAAPATPERIAPNASAGRQAGWGG